MRILIISDTHRSLYYLNDVILRHPEGFDACIHLGDAEGQDEDIEALVGAPLYIVRGNCDYFVNNEDYLGLTLGNKECLLTHGHLFGAKNGKEGLLRAAKEIGADCVFFGHTHIAEITKKDGILFVNPGSLTYPKNSKPSYAIAEIKENGEMDIKLDYL